MRQELLLPCQNVHCETLKPSWFLSCFPTIQLTFSCGSHILAPKFIFLAFSTARPLRGVVAGHSPAPHVVQGKRRRWQKMLVYEFYRRDEMGRDLFIGRLKERRKDDNRITEESILNWGKKVICQNGEVGDIYFYISEIDEA